MRMYDIISKKKNKLKLNKEEIEFFINGIVNNEIPDYQTSSLLMAIYLNGLDEQETTFLTNSMANSGDIINLDKIQGIKLDKHSTGGVGDKTTLVVCPILASLGEKIAKMSGKGLGFTGGTIDKLNSIPGYNTILDRNAFIEQVNEINIALISQSGNIAPADKILYALRDSTSTVESIPLIASSIMSKKIASGADNILLDVKVGNGAFMKNIEDAKHLANTMIKLGTNLNKKVSAIITDMSTPIGNNIGNSLEVIEAIETLKGKGPKDFTKLCLEISTLMLMDSKKLSYEEANEKINYSITSGIALEKFKQLIEYQSGNKDIINNYDLLPKSKFKKEILSTKEGFITKINTEKIGLLSVALGAGRNKKDEEIDYGAGIIMHKKINDYIKKGDCIATYFTSKDIIIDQDYIHCLEINEEKIKENPLIYEIINEESI